MSFDEFRAEVFALAADAGCAAAELFFAEGESFSAGVLNGKLDSYSVSREFGLNLRVKLDGKDGYAYTETLDDAKTLLERAMDNARAIEKDDEHPMQGASEYKTVPETDIPMTALSEHEKIALALELERETLKADKRVKRVMECKVGTGRGRTRIVNTLGLDAEEKTRMALIYSVPVAQKGADVKDGFAFRVNGEAMDVSGCAAEAAGEAVSYLGAAPVPPGEYRVILRRDAAAVLMEAFFPLFSAEEAQKGLSLLADKEGETVAAECVTLMDDPFHEYNPRAFDAEGVPSVTKSVIENGVLKTLLHNLKTAKKAGATSTSNAGRGSAAAPIGVSPSNFYIKPGETSFDELMTQLGDGLIITDLAGLHSGLNTVSGEFSLLAKGALIKAGKRVRPVDQITLGGSFLSLMKAVERVGNDMYFTLPDSGSCGSPSLLIGSLMVSGEE